MVTINTPLHPETEHMFNDKLIGMMKRGSYIVNTARGKICDRDAIVRALESGQPPAMPATVVPTACTEGPSVADHAATRHDDILGQLAIGQTRYTAARGKSSTVFR